MKSSAIYIMAIAIVLGAAVFAFYAHAGPAAQSTTHADALDLAATSTLSGAVFRESSTSAAAIAGPSGSLSYRNAQYRFSVTYPPDLEVHAYDEGGGASTVTFQSVKDSRGFQVFVVPYAASTISDAQFRKDEPSGVRTGVNAVMIAGVKGVSFYSTNLALGETAEVWFIHGGYLFEVTTLKPLAPWLSGIMQSWQFE